MRAAIAAGLEHSDRTGPLPAMSDGKLALARASDLAGELLPPSTAGWQRYLELAPASGLKFTALKEAGEDWWGRKIPTNLLSVSEAASAKAPEVPLPAPAPAAAASLSRSTATASTPEAEHSPGDSSAEAPAPVRLKRTHLPPGISVE